MATGPHLWEIRPVRDLLVLALAVGAVWLAIQIQAALIPAIVGFVLAYLFDPVIAWIQKRLGGPRWPPVALFLVLLVGAAVALTLVIMPMIAGEITTLAEELPRSVEYIEEEYGIEIPLDREMLVGTDKGEPIGARIVTALLKDLEPVLSVAGSVVGLTTYAAIATVLTLAVFAITALNFQRLPNVRQYLPASRREELWEIVTKIERVFAGFFRGQILVAFYTTGALALGFSIAGVPYWFIAALVGGVASVVPYGQLLGWILAVLFNFLDAAAGGAGIDPVRVLLGPSIVYAVMQSLETFVVTPLVQGSATRLHPVVVLACIVGGASLGGLVGVFLAIPVAASVKILSQDVLLPRWREWAAEH